MNFKSISITNFRNFDEIQCNLENKNVFFGMNDVGKSNLLHALRVMFDYNVRKNNLTESDFHCKNIDKPIEIIVELEISDDVDDHDSNKLRAKLKGAISSSSNTVYIKLFAQYSREEGLAIPILTWGNDLKALSEIGHKGTYFDLDRVFNVIFIDAYVDSDTLFKKNINKLIDQSSKDESDIKNNREIDEIIKKLNDVISDLKGVQEFNKNLGESFSRYLNDKVDIKVVSEIALTGLFSNLTTYISDKGGDLYPTNGEGRKKLLSYTLYDLLAKTTENQKINLFLIEEPENHLHKSVQIGLSKLIFSNDKYKYMFVTTHSPFILYEMDNLSLVRLHGTGKVQSNSSIINLNEDYNESKYKISYFLSEAIFAKKVLLVEGPSERILFKKVLSIMRPEFEIEGVYILDILGINFKTYYNILKDLDIDIYLRTDNDFNKVQGKETYRAAGAERLLKLSCNKDEKFLNLNDGNQLDVFQDKEIETKKAFYNKNKAKLDDLRKNEHLYLSIVDLEHDLKSVLQDRLDKLVGSSDPVKEMQKSKQYAMVELVKSLSEYDCEKIYNSYEFAILTDVIDGL